MVPIVQSSSFETTSCDLLSLGLAGTSTSSHCSVPSTSVDVLPSSPQDRPGLPVQYDSWFGQPENWMRRTAR